MPQSTSFFSESRSVMKLHCQWVLIAVVILISPGLLAAQTTGGGATGGGNTGGGTNGGGITGGATTGGGGGADPNGDFQGQELDNKVFDDIRREVRFAGQTNDTIVHPYSSTLVLETNVDAIGGRDGSTTDTTAARTTTGTTGGANTNAFQSPFGQLFGNAFGFGGATQQQPAVIRSRLSFAKTELMGTPEGQGLAINTGQIGIIRSSQVTSRMRLIPGLAQQDFQVQLGPDGTAVLVGTVENEARKNQIERLMKFEPGISKIENRLTTLQ